MKKEINSKTFGERVKKVRLKKGLTQQEFGDLFKATRSNVSKWERGKSLPNKKRLKEIADFDNITVDELLYGSSATLKELNEFLSSIKGSKLADEVNNYTLEKLDIMIENWTDFNE